MYTGPEVGFTDVIFSDDHSSVSTVKGKVVMYFQGDTAAPGPDILQRNGAVGVIYVRNPSSRFDCPATFPCVYLDIFMGSDIFFHMETTRLSYKRLIFLHMLENLILLFFLFCFAAHQRLR